MEKETIGDATLYCGDSLEWIESVPECFSVDLLLTDPPFGIGNFIQDASEKWGRGENYGGHVDWNDSGPPERFFRWARKHCAHRIIWGANFFNCFEEKGGAIVWDKVQQMRDVSKCEIASCTHFKKTEIVRIPWTNFQVVHEAKTDHPCERPVRLYEWCLQYIPGEHNVVLDPFFGSGSVGVACANLGKKFIGIEKQRKYFDIACERIAAAYAQGRLFA